MQQHTNLTTHEAAEYLRVSERTLIRWRVLRVGPPWAKAGHSVRYRRTDLDAWLTSRTVTPLPEEA